MRIIKYKEKKIDQYQAYVDIGSCEKHYDSLPLYNDEAVPYRDWYLNFRNYPLGVKMLIVNYYLLQFYSDNFIPKPLDKKITENIDLLNNFNIIWFDEEFPLFKGLDLNREDINDEISEIIVNNENFIYEVKFYDGSSICFLDEDDTIQSFYVRQNEYEQLKKDFDIILEVLK